MLSFSVCVCGSSAGGEVTFICQLHRYRKRALKSSGLMQLRKDFKWAYIRGSL